MQQEPPGPPDSFRQRSTVDFYLVMRFVCGGLNFVIAWAYLISRWPMVGIVFGWAPAIIAAIFGFFAADILLDALT
ncbi:MAG TPA: hypothetical protein VN229_01480 [Terriglobales bacterium]|nr:hypothetical protein [Terriglobales bacterium]